ncbi:MAG: anti-sigma factor antagonist, partial [Calditrichae bacterium]|nr:anti-sigma factor antagonist [Calditrichia bacterium]
MLKFSGDIRYTMGCSLDDFLKKLFKRSDFETILIDLTETRSIDSTSLGLLAKIANFMQHQFHQKAPLVSTN